MIKVTVDLQLDGTRQVSAVELVSGAVAPSVSLTDLTTNPEVVTEMLEDARMFRDNDAEVIGRWREHNRASWMCASFMGLSTGDPHFTPIVRRMVDWLDAHQGDVPSLLELESLQFEVSQLLAGSSSQRSLQPPSEPLKPPVLIGPVAGF